MLWFLDVLHEEVTYLVRPCEDPPGLGFGQACHLSFYCPFTVFTVFLALDLRLPIETYLVCGAYLTLAIDN